MPYQKAISGHTGCRRLGRYLTFSRDGSARAIAVETINVAETDREGTRWWDAMDETREAFGNGSGRGGSGRTRTYQHYIISLDPRDDVAPEEFLAYVRAWAERWFDGELGSYEVAIVLHDDNLERTERGEDGILHAHVVVNNTDLESGRRLSPRLSNRVVQAMRVDLEQAAYARGWRSFSEAGVSMTPQEMAAAGARPTPTRGDAVRRLLLDEGSQQPRFEVESEPTARDVGSSVQRRPEPGRRRTGTIRRWMDLGDGRVLIVPADLVPHGQRRQETMAERAHRRRAGWSWKEDIRSRVDMGMRVARSMRDLESYLNVVGVSVSYASDGEIKFTDPRGSGREVRGSTLGAGYGISELSGRLADNAGRVAKGSQLPGSGSSLSRAQRKAIARAVAEARAGTREGQERVDALGRLVDEVERRGIDGYDGFSDSDTGKRQRGLAEEIGLFDGEPDAPESVSEGLELIRRERAKRGEGGLDADSDREHPVSRRTHEDDARGEEPRRRR